MIPTECVQKGRTWTSCYMFVGKKIKIATDIITGEPREMV